MDGTDKINALKKIAWSLFSTDEEERMERIKGLHDKRWGQGKHDAPLEDDKSILIRNGSGMTSSKGGKKPPATFSTDTQIVPDSALKWLQDHKRLYKSMLFAPPYDDTVRFLKDPYRDIYDYLNTAPRLPANWEEYSRTLSDNISSKFAPEAYWAPITNAIHYAAQPMLTGAMSPKKDSPEMRELARMYSTRLAEGLRHNLWPQQDGNGYAKK